MNRALLPVIACAALLSLTAAHAQTYNLQDLGTLGDNPFRQSSASSINDTGAITGTSLFGGLSAGLLWPDDITPTDLPAPDDYGANTYGNSINAGGEVVGLTFDAFGDHAAFLYKNGASTLLNAPAGAGANATAINTAGQIVGTTSIAGYAFSYDNGNTTNLGLLTGGTTSVATAINNANPAGIVGSADLASGNTHAVLFANGRVYDLGTLGGPNSNATGVNDQGQIAGQSDINQKDVNNLYYHHAFLWTPNTAHGTTGTMRDLGVLPGGTDSGAYALNNSGTVIGNADLSAGSTCFVWDSAHGMQNLQALVVNTNFPIPYDSGAYLMEQASGINSRGQIVGTYSASFEGTIVEHAYVLAPTGEAAPAAPNALAAAVPAAQFTLTAGASTNMVNLTWHSNSINETHFLVERADGTSNTFNPIATTPGSYATTYTDTTVQPSLSYTYRVRATNTYGTSAPSNTVSVTTGPSSLTLTKLSYSPTTVKAGTGSNGTVTISGAAPTGGANVAFTLDGSPLGIVTVAAGQTSNTYTQPTDALLAGAHTLAAMFNGKRLSATLSVTTDTSKPTPLSLSYSPSTVAPGGKTTATLTLSAAAPSGGAGITITDNGNTLGILTVPAGQTKTTYTLTAGSTGGTYTDHAIYNGKQATATYTITGGSAVILAGVLLNPTSVTGGTSSTGTITLTGPAPTGGLAVTLKSSDTSVATLAGTLNIAAGATSANFKVTTHSVTSTKMVTLTATAGSTSKTATLTVNPAAGAVTLSSLVLTPTSVTAGAISTGKITLAAVAPTGGATVTLKSSDTSSATVPSSVTIVAGDKSISFTVTTKSVTSTKTPTITATLGSSVKTATLTITPATTAVTAKSLTATPSAVSSDGQTSCILTLSGSAPSGGASIPISANGTVFTTATIPAGQTSVTFLVNWGVSPGTSTNVLSASYGGKTVSATVTVSATSVTLKAYTFSPNPIVSGQTATAKVTLSSAAPAGGAVVTIDYNGAYFYQFVIAAGQTSGTYPQATSIVTATTPYPFTATYNGASLSKTLTVTP